MTADVWFDRARNDHRSYRDDLHARRIGSRSRSFRLLPAVHQTALVSTRRSKKWPRDFAEQGPPPTQSVLVTAEIALALVL